MKWKTKKSILKAWRNNAISLLEAVQALASIGVGTEVAWSIVEEA